MQLDDFEMYVVAQALLRCSKDPDWVEDLAVEYDTGDEFWHELNRKCRRTVEKHG